VSLKSAMIRDDSWKEVMSRETAINSDYLINDGLIASPIGSLVSRVLTAPRAINSILRQRERERERDFRLL